MDAPCTLGLFVIKVNTASNSNLWVLDTNCGLQICTDVEEPKNCRQLNKGESDLRVGNGARVIALTIGTYVLTLPRGFILNMDDCYYVHVLTKIIISVSYLNKKGFHFIFMNNNCFIMLNYILYASGTLCNGIYILDMSNSILIVHDNKRQKHDNLKSSFLWHYHLGHINEIHMVKLHKSESLGSFDYESCDTCEYCLLGKMTKLPFNGKDAHAN